MRIILKHNGSWDAAGHSSSDTGCWLGMALRGYTDRFPVLTRSRENHWPGVSIGAPHRQFYLLAAKYKDKAQGRNATAWSLLKLLQANQQRAHDDQEPYLLQWTALNELRAWM